MRIRDIEVKGLGKRCREARLRYQKRTGANASYVAERLKFSRSYLYEIEDDENPYCINMKNIEAMEELYGEQLLVRPSVKKEEDVELA